MIFHKSIRRVALVLAALLASPMHAQFSPFVTLPNNDFQWQWGDWEKSGNGKRQDFSVRGSESGFRCELTGKLRPASRMTQSEIRSMETSLGTNMFFIQAAASAMNQLDLQRELDWAQLACARFQPTETDEQATQEKVDKAREKAVQEMLERRARQQRREQE